MRKQKIPNQLQNLTDEDLKLLHSWMSKFTYRQIQEKLRLQFGIEICTSQLSRYFQRLSDLEALNAESQQPLKMTGLMALRNDDPIPTEQLNLNLLQRQCLRLAQKEGHTPRSLLDLMHVCNYPQSRSRAEKQLQLDERMQALREQRAQLKRYELALKQVKAKSPASP